MMMRDETPMQAEKFLELLRPIERDLEIYCRRMIWDANDMNDTIQNAVWRAFRAFDRYREDASFRAWMFKILTNEIFTANRKHGRITKNEVATEPEEMESFAALEQATQYADWLCSPDALKENFDQDIVTALRSLTEMERAVLLQRAIGEFRYREISESLAIPLGSVMGHLSRARKKMRDALMRSQRRSNP
jgi:RNA polymerase sigma-70 factor (ECF subfamily)